MERLMSVEPIRMSKCKRTLHNELPEEHPEQYKCRFGRLLRHLYGVRDASQNLGLRNRALRGGAERSLHFYTFFQNSKQFFMF